MAGTIAPGLVGEASTVVVEEEQTAPDTWAAAASLSLGLRLWWP